MDSWASAFRVVGTASIPAEWRVTSQVVQDFRVAALCENAGTCDAKDVFAALALPDSPVCVQFQSFQAANNGVSVVIQSRVLFHISRGSVYPREVRIGTKQ